MPKTTSASALALAASRAGRRVLLVSTDPAHNTSDIFARPIGPDIVEVAPQYDGPGQITALLAANLLFEFLSLVALNR